MKKIIILIIIFTLFISCRDPDPSFGGYYPTMDVPTSSLGITKIIGSNKAQIYVMDNKIASILINADLSTVSRFKKHMDKTGMKMVASNPRHSTYKKEINNLTYTADIINRGGKHSINWRCNQLFVKYLESLDDIQDDNSPNI